MQFLTRNLIHAHTLLKLIHIESKIQLYILKNKNFNNWFR